ncbi:MAG: hypothetical protein ACREC4_03340 [Methylocella sp.]
MSKARTPAFTHAAPRRRVSWRLAEAKLRLTVPGPGGLGDEAALTEGGDRYCDRNRGGPEEDEFWHGKNLHLSSFRSKQYTCQIIAFAPRARGTGHDGLATAMV